MSKESKPGGSGRGSGDEEQGVSRMMRTVVAWLILFAGGMIILMVVDRQSPQAVPVQYNEYVRLLDKGAIKSALIIKSQVEDYEFRGELVEEMDVRVAEGTGETRRAQSISTFLPSVNEEMMATWEEKLPEGYKFDRNSEFWGWIMAFLPWIFVIALMVFFFRRMQGAGTRGIFSFGKSRAKMLSESSPRMTFADVAGAEEAKEELYEIVEFLRDPAKFQRLGAKIPRGVLLLGPPGTGKCVVGDTLVLTNKGMMEIRDVPKYYWVDPQTDQVHGASLPTVDPVGMEDTIRPASHWYNLGAQPTLRLSTKQGMSIEGTPEHPIVVVNDQGELEFRELRDIQVGDQVAVKYGSEVFGTLDDVDPEQAYLMGLITGDGNMSISNRVELTTADEQIAEFFGDHMRGRYGADLNVRLKGDGLTHVVSSWRVKKDLFDAGLSSLLSYDKKIPASILQGSKSVVVSFLQGLFDADGYFDRYMFGYCTASRSLAHQVTTLLLNLGIVPRTRIKKQPTDDAPSTIWEVTVSGTSLPVFAEQIGFRLERKQRQLQEYLARPGVCTNTNVDLFDGEVAAAVVECWQELSRLGRSTSRLAAMIDKARTRGRVSRNSMREFVEVFEQGGVSHPQVGYLRSLLSLDLFFTPVVEIREGFANVYDFTVPEVHSFISNGMISHNTLLAKAIAGEAGVQFLSISGADFVEMFVGVGASRVRDLFEQAKKVAPAIVFIDEIDAVGRQRGAGLGGGHDEREQTLNALLVEMDGFEANTGVIIIAATNRPDVLDPALLRPGRFDRQVVVDLPDRRGREGILRVHSRKLPLAENVDLEAIAKSTPGFSGADLANLCNEAAIFAARRNGDRVTMYDFEMAKDKLMLGLERRSMVMSEEEKKMTAYHEVGHVLVGRFVPHGDPLHKVTIIPRGRALGVTHFLPDDDKHSRSREWFEAKIAMALGGRAAELLVFGNYTSGAQGDIKMVTQMARQMVCELGMSEKLGPVNYSQGDGEVFLGRDFAAHKDISESTAEMIDQEVRAIVDTGMELALKVLREHDGLLHRMSALLIERETLDAEEIEMVVRGEELPPLEVKKMLQARMAAEGGSGGPGSKG